ncbi:MAG: CCA tRNA nucleotidyltransferase [Chloroflexi bacterium]|nr:CCA tRNA nucleotidyltransferase [Chloroflexota bacterium]
MPASSPNLTSLLPQRLPTKVFAFVQRIAEEASETRLPVYLVGGVVRDLFLDRPVLDADFAVVGDAHALARRLAKRLGGRAVIHDQFGTATVYVEGRSFDLAMTRTERYAHPGALPIVSPGSLRDDLNRRDFTINAMAISLNEGSFGQVIDPLGGRDDVHSRKIRILHDDSFVDDPTRCYRACRYAARFDFTIEKLTNKLLVEGTKMVAAVSGDRLRHEVERTLEEAEPEKAFDLLRETWALQSIHYGLRWDEKLFRWFERARKVGLAAPNLYLALLGLRLKAETIEAVAERLRLASAKAAAMRDGQRLWNALAPLEDASIRPSGVVALLSTYANEAVAACRVATPMPIIETHLRRYQEELRSVQAELNGDDVIALGVPRGPDIGKLLRALHDARLDGEVSNRDGEAALVRRWLEHGLP